MNDVDTRAENYAPLNGVKAPNLGVVFEGHKSVSEHETMSYD